MTYLLYIYTYIIRLPSKYKRPHRKNEVHNVDVYIGTTQYCLFTLDIVVNIAKINITRTIYIRIYRDFIRLF